MLRSQRDTPLSGEQGGPTCSPESISLVVGLPSDQRGYCPSLCSSLPSHNIKTVPLCACILGNLPPTMERALASAWEEYGATERKSKGEGDRGRWKTGRDAGQKRESEGTSRGICHTQMWRVKMRRESKGLKQEEGSKTNET